MPSGSIGVMACVVRGLLLLLRFVLRGVMFAMVVACSVLVFGFVALTDWVGHGLRH